MNISSYNAVGILIHFRGAIIAIIIGCHDESKLLIDPYNETQLLTLKCFYKLVGFFPTFLKSKSVGRLHVEINCFFGRPSQTSKA